MGRWRCQNSLSLHVLSPLMPRQLTCHEQFCSRWHRLSRAHVVFLDSCVVKMEEEVKGHDLP